MASSSSHRKKNTNKPMELKPNPRRGHLGFRSEKEKEWYEDWFEQRTVVAERASYIHEFAEFEFEFLLTFARRVGWINFLKTNVGECNATICREFIASLIERPDYEYFAFVRGKEIPFTPYVLSNFLRIPVISNYILPYSSPENAPDENVVYKYLTGTPKTNAKFKIQSTRLLPHMHTLWMVVCNSLYPTTHKNHIYFDEALIVYNIAKDNNICLMRYLVKMIARPAGKLEGKETIKIGVLITRYCAHFEVEVKDGDQYITQLGPVTNSTIRRSQGQLHTRH